MILCDAGPLFALFSYEEPELQEICNQAMSRMTEPLITTWVCFGEAMYLLGKRKRIYRQIRLWANVERRSLQFYNLTETDARRMKELMVKYHDHPMDLGDASLIVAAEALGARSVFTLDDHFRSYLINDRTPFHVIP